MRMKRKLITCVSCQSNGEFWCLDEQIYVLCKINMESLQAECKLSPMKILADELSEVRKLIAWEDKILILPAWLEQRWGVYDKNTGDLEYVNFLWERYELAEAVLIGDRLILIPVFANDPVVIMDLRERRIIARQYLQDIHFTPNRKMEIWQVRDGDSKICFLLRGTRHYGEIREEQVRLVKIRAPETLWCADFYEDGGWAVGSYGKSLYQFDREGNLLDSISIDLKVEIVRMVVKSQYIFLLPAEGERIWIFDRNSRQVKQDNMAMEENEPILPPLLREPSYWGYQENEHTIWFLPLLYPLKIMDTDTLLCQQKVITYTERFSREKYWIYYKYAMFTRNIKNRFPICENPVGNVEGYLEFMKNYSYVSEKERKLCGERIWEALCEV